MVTRSVSSPRSPSSVQPAGATSLLLRRALIADALITGATGALMLAGAGPLHDWLDLPTALLRWAGLFLIAYAGLVARVGTRPTINRSAVKGIIAANLVWAVGCLALLAGDRIDPNGWGIAFILVQVAAVVFFAVVQGVGLRTALTRRESATLSHAGRGHKKRLVRLLSRSGRGAGGEGCPVRAATPAPSRRSCRHAFPAGGSIRWSCRGRWP